MVLSVIITAYDKPEITRVHVRECMNSSLLPDEIIVVNDHGKIELEEMLQGLEKKTKLIYAYIEDDIPWNYTGARNLGFWLSRGDFIVSEDNDNIPTKNLYRDMLRCLQEKPEIGVVRGGGRPLVSQEDVLSKPIGEWKQVGWRAAHDDSFMMRREVVWKLKGCDERFAGEYGWGATDWTRRLNRAGIGIERITTPYYTVDGGDTDVCQCGKSKAERTAAHPKFQCPDCGLFYKRLSYRNYHLARKKTYIQPPGSILNFNYVVKYVE